MQISIKIKILSKKKLSRKIGTAVNLQENGKKLSAEDDGEFKADIFQV